MKKLAFGAVLIGMIGVLTACGDGNQKQEQTKKTSTSTSKSSIAETKGEDTEEITAESFYGTWKITNYYASGISAMSKEEMEGYIGKEVEYGEDYFISDGMKTELPEYQVNEITAEEFAVEYNQGMTFATLGITNEWITVVDIDNSYEAGAHLYIKDKNTIFFSFDGIFFEGKRK